MIMQVVDAWSQEPGRSGLRAGATRWRAAARGRGESCRRSEAAARPAGRPRSL